MIAGVPRRDAALAAVLSAGASAEVVLQGTGPVAAPLALALLACLALAMRAARPLAVAVAQAGAFAGFAILAEEPPSLPVIALIVGLFTAGERLTGLRAVVALCCPLAGAFGQVAVTHRLEEAAWLVAVLLVPPFLAGRAVRTKRRQIADLEDITRRLATEHARAERLATEAERVRLAREMHDVLSHGIGLVALQAAAGERLASIDPDRARATLDSIRKAAAGALAELEATMGAGGPQLPKLGDLDEVVGRLRAAGVTVAVERTGRLDDVAPGVEAAATRIAQEALTNVMRHAGRGPARLRVHADGARLEITVEDEGEASTPEPGAGRGLAGMRERAAAYGGTVEAGPRAAGGFRVAATLPAGGRR